jgi:DNA-directed RNA polymerase subunit beta'
LRTFHTGGVASEDIITGLPRVEELFEARKPKGQAIITEESGTVHIQEDKGIREVVVTDAEGEEHAYEIPFNVHVTVHDGVHVEAGDQLIEGSVNPHDILRIKGETALQNYLVQEVQKVYRSQGVDINDKHIEVIVRSMLRKKKVTESGGTRLLPGQMFDAEKFFEENAKAVAAGIEPAKADTVLLGVTKASLATESFLSAASFQETTRVLTQAAIEGKYDPLLGLKENVIIGKLIPAGTGMPRYRSVESQVRGRPVFRESDIFSDLPEDQTLASEIAVADEVAAVEDSGLSSEFADVADSTAPSVSDALGVPTEIDAPLTGEDLPPEISVRTTESEVAQSPDDVAVTESHADVAVDLASTEATPASGAEASAFETPDGGTSDHAAAFEVPDLQVRSHESEFTHPVEPEESEPAADREL